jgi:hypothetical protein
MKPMLEQTEHGYSMGGQVARKGPCALGGVPLCPHLTHQDFEQMHGKEDGFRRGELALRSTRGI